MKIISVAEELKSVGIDSDQFMGVYEYIQTHKKYPTEMDDISSPNLKLIQTYMKSIGVIEIEKNKVSIDEKGISILEKRLLADEELKKFVSKEKVKVHGE